VRNFHLITLIYTVCLLIFVSGCTTTPDVSQVPNPTLETPTTRSSPTILPSPTYTASPTPEPEFLFPFISIIDEQDPRGFSILGLLVNNTTHAVTEVEIRATIYFNTNEPPIWKEISLPYQHILPSERVPILIDFSIQLAPKNVSLEVVSFKRSGYEDAKLEIELIGTTFTLEGEHILYGWITNPDNTTVQIHQLYFLARSSLDNPTALLSSSFHPSSIFPQQRVPFLVTLDTWQEQGSDSFEPFIDATIIPELEEPSFSIPQYPEAILDPQGNILVRGIIQNQDEISMWVSATVAMLYQDQIVSVATMNPPFPLGPGETRGFGLTNFPGWKERLDELGGQLDDLSIEVFYDPLGCREFKGQIAYLTVEVIGFESTGSTLLLRGNASNPSSHTLSQPAIQAEIRTTTGVLQTSNWILLDEIIAQGQTINFVLGIKLPQGIKLSDMEIDVTGTAILEDSVVPY
jgi:hypothetical protein